MASDRADGIGLSAVGSQAPSVPPLEGIEGAVVEAQSPGSGNALEGSRPPRIPIDPKLYGAAVEGDVKLLDDFLQSPDLHQLDGVTIGDNTLLHIAAISSRDLPWKRKGDYVDFAKKVYIKNRSLLMACNRLKETPLHCAAKAGNYRMVCLLISSAEEEDQAVKQTLLAARNMHGETALHEAVRVGHMNIVKKLIESEPSLADIVDAEGVSPLYLATMTNALNIVEIFTISEYSSQVSYAGPKGQTALHAAVLEHTGITRTLLTWNKSLATKVDHMESTPLHYAASVGNMKTVQLLLKDEIKEAACMADKDGLFPIHIAAKCGRRLVIMKLIKQFPDSDELLDKEGRNFLHLAILSGKRNIFYFMGYNRTFLRMLNARDYQGNTPLHLASESGDLRFVRLLISFKKVHSSIMNKEGLTPVDLAMKEVDGGLKFILDTKFNILRCMIWTGALPSPRRSDHLRNDLKIPMSDKKREIEKVESISRNLAIISVLIATVTFAASFTLPGGYIADDHVHRGTPILSWKYAFKAFIVANLLAFLLSVLSTSLLIYAGSANVDLKLRSRSLLFSTVMVRVAVKYTMCAFALALYTMLYQVNLRLSILVCVATSVLILFRNMAYWGVLSLATPIMNREGFIGLFKSHIRPWSILVEFGLGRTFVEYVSSRAIFNIFLYGLIFLLALL